ncbi:HD domain-containing protein [Aliiglaciecola sp. SL4]|uniref:HD domain-containing protein n=1 Tax=Aliiglaciecola sp. SL4 TaxID=3239806 RepID=UPI00355BEEA0
MAKEQVKAREFAVKLHADQKYGKHPYSYHLDDVAAKAKAFGKDAEVIAYLHDVVEDTSATIEDIEYQFGKLVADCVAVVTDEKGATRQERKKKTYQKMAKVTGETELALIVKVCDRLSNVKTSVKDQNSKMFSMYCREHDVFRTSAYRQGLCDELWQELDKLIATSKQN